MRYYALALGALTLFFSGCGTLVGANDGSAVENGGSAPPSDDPASDVGSPAPSSDTPASKPPPSAPVTKIVFVTSTTFTGEKVEGISGGDATCNKLGASFGTKKFVSWLSAGSDRAIDRLPKDVVYVRPDGVRVGAVSSLLSGLERPISIAEDGTTPSSGRVWTWTRADGDAGQACKTKSGIGIGIAGVNVNVGSDGKPTLGNLSKITSEWTDAEDGSDCDTLAHLYCFEI
jgi:hypothetical protein